MKIEQDGTNFYFENGDSTQAPLWVRSDAEYAIEWFQKCYCKEHSITPEFVEKLPMRFRWTVQIDVDAAQVANGFDLSNRGSLTVSSYHGGCIGRPAKVTIINSPDPADIERVRESS